MVRLFIKAAWERPSSCAHGVVHGRGDGQNGGGGRDPRECPLYHRGLRLHKPQGHFCRRVEKWKQICACGTSALCYGLLHQMVRGLRAHGMFHGGDFEARPLSHAAHSRHGGWLCALLDERSGVQVDSHRKRTVACGGRNPRPELSRGRKSLQGRGAADALPRSGSRKGHHAVFLEFIQQISNIFKYFIRIFTAQSDFADIRPVFLKDAGLFMYPCAV